MASFNYGKTNLVLTFEVDQGNGEFTKKRVTLSNVRSDLTADEILQITSSLAGLVKHSLTEVERIVYESIAG